MTDRKVFWNGYNDNFIQRLLYQAGGRREKKFGATQAKCKEFPII